MLSQKKERCPRTILNSYVQSAASASKVVTRIFAKDQQEKLEIATFPLAVAVVYTCGLSH